MEDGDEDRDALTAGRHILKLAIDANGANGTAADINWIAVR